MCAAAEITAPAGQLVTVLAERMNECRERLAKLQKRGARYGQSLTWSETPRLEQRGFVRVDGVQVKRMVAVVDLVICGEAPRVGDYELQAALERAPGGVIVSSAPGVSVGKLGRQWDGRCDHCGSVRDRVHGYIVVKGRTRKVVGKSCLRDYLGTDVPSNIASRFAYLRDVTDEGDDGWGGFGGSYLDLTVGLIAEARACIHLFGWRPASFAGQTTSGLIAMFARPIMGGKERDADRAMQRKYHDELKANGERYHAEAEEIMAWAKALRPGRSDYLHNLQVACGAEVVKAKHRGLVVSASAAFDKQKEVEAERAAVRAALPPSDWYGIAGTRYKRVEMTLQRTVALPDNGFGPSTIYKFVTPEGHLLSWKTGTVARDDRNVRVEPGKSYLVTFSVKGHGEYKEVRETYMSRCKIDAVPA